MLGAEEKAQVLSGWWLRWRFPAYPPYFPTPRPPSAHLQHNEDLQELVVRGSQLRHTALLHLQLLFSVYCTF